MKLFAISFILVCILIPTLCHKGKSDLLRVCYYTPDNLPPDRLNASLCSHIIAGFSVVTNGVIDLGPSSKIQLYVKTTDLKKTHPDLKVMLTVGGGGSNGGFSEAFNSTWNRTRFIASTLTSLGKYNFDGLDVDWEFPVWNDNTPEDKENFIKFLHEFNLLAKAYSAIVGKPPALLTVAVAAPKTIIDASYDILQMAKYVDFINLMTYDYHDYFWYTPFTDHNSPLFNRSVEESYFATLNTAWTANYWYEQGMPKSKIIVGIPTYAHTYTLVDPLINGVDAPASGTFGDITFSDVCDMLAFGGTHVFDNESKVPYAYRGHDWVSYEDSQSITEKAKWIISNGYGGAMTYNLNSDDWSCSCDKQPFLLHRILYDIFTQ